MPDVVNEIHARIEAGLDGLARGAQITLAGALQDGIGVSAGERRAHLLDSIGEIAGAVGRIGDEQRLRLGGGRHGFISLDLAEQPQQNNP